MTHSDDGYLPMYDPMDGFRTAGNRTAWEWNTEDVYEVLLAHEKVPDNYCISHPLVQRCFDLCASQERRIEKAVLYYCDFETQCDSFFDELENILMEHGILTGPKRYKAPDQEV